MPIVAERIPRQLEWKSRFPMTPLLRELNDGATDRRIRRYKRGGMALAGVVITVALATSGALEDPQRVESPHTSTSVPARSPVVPQENR